jgi:hypothetical protein
MQIQKSKFFIRVENQLFSCRRASKNKADFRGGSTAGMAREVLTGMTSYF